MACAMSPLYFVGSLPLMGATLFVAGFAIAPTMIAAMSLTEETVPSGRLTEGMAIMQTGLVAGVAPGATLCRPGRRPPGRVRGVPRLARRRRRAVVAAGAAAPQVVTRAPSGPTFGDA